MADNEEGSDGEYTVNDELMDCARYGEIDDVRRLLTSEPGVDVNFVDDSGNTATHNAAANGHHEIVRLLLQSGARLTRNSSGNTPLHWAAQLGQLEAVKVLLTAPDADVLVKNSFGVSAVTEAMKKNRDDIAIELLRHRSADKIEEPSETGAAASSGAGDASATGAVVEGGGDSDEDDEDEDDTDDEGDARGEEESKS